MGLSTRTSPACLHTRIFQSAMRSNTMFTFVRLQQDFARFDGKITLEDVEARHD
jgi:hypothetical protein